MRVIYSRNLSSNFILRSLSQAATATGPSNTPTITINAVMIYLLHSEDNRAKGIAFVPRIVTPQTVADDRPGASQFTVPALNRVDIENPLLLMLTWLDLPTL